MVECEARGPQAAHRVAENGRRGQLQRIQNFTRKPTRDCEHVDAAIIEGISEAMSGPIYREHAITMRQRRHERRPLRGFS
jgi:hypothetical protein